ncbi:MAG: hypothetical protein WCS88_05155 [Patescibacteria group bacterium]|jgi:pimeloyl-ACP methyl ester carboxylesterase
MSKWELDWLHNDKAKMFYPDAWQVYSAGLKKNQTSNLIEVFYKKVFSKVIIQGRYDMICPPITAWKLHETWTKADFEMIEASGHHSSEKNNIDVIIKYTNKMLRYKI